jgi:hypothetical protein
MKITSKILSIPPYISTAWRNIASLQMVDASLIISLVNDAKIEIPHLKPEMLEAIFAAHAAFIDDESASQKTSVNMPPALPQDPLFGLGFPIKISPGDNLGAVLQHNSEQAHMPDLPPEVLEKITSIAKTIGIEEGTLLPKPEPHCNCVHCQIAKAIQQGADALEEIEKEEEVSAEDLKFRLWDIEQSSDKLYIVSNPCDQEEHYQVYLGEPIGCTCGQKHCEHVRAVLNT